MYPTSFRTHTCGELKKNHLNKKVQLAGWVATRRDHGGIIFIDLRDRYGITQIIFDPNFHKQSYQQAEFLRREDCIKISGIVKSRKKGMQNRQLPTGQIEVFINQLEVISKSETPPIEIDDRIVAKEDIRLKYRYLDLRRPVMQKNLIMRSKILQETRKFFIDNGFIEIQTPLLVRPTPEGARDYIVPSRVNPGKFYALPQSPQLYKQILMISGFDRYFQAPAICLRDEDLRADRQPEHSQIDLEMSFVSSKDVRDFVESYYKDIFKTILNVKLGKFQVLTYQECMDKYGTDKPDLRFNLELSDVTEIVKDSEFSIFKDAIKNKGIVKCINPQKDFTRTELENLVDFCIKAGSKGMAYLKYANRKLEGSITKYLSDNVKKELIKKTGIKKGYLLFIADKPKKTNAVLADLRNKLGKDLGLIKKSSYKFLWVVDFPLFSYNGEENKWEPEHHMFTSPKPEHIQLLESNPGAILGDLFDLVLNGTELGSGSIRINRPDIQERVMKVIGLSQEQAHKKFGFLLDAYNYAGPVHGGMGLGFDRLVALMLGYNDIREVIAFPKNKEAQNPMDNSPSEVEHHQLKEANIKVDLEKKK